MSGKVYRCCIRARIRPNECLSFCLAMHSFMYSLGSKSQNYSYCFRREVRMVTELFSLVRVRYLKQVKKLSVVGCCSCLLLTCTSTNGTSAPLKASTRATDVCVQAPALITMNDVPSVRAAWIRSSITPSWLVCRDSNWRSFCLHCSAARLVMS